MSTTIISLRGDSADFFQPMIVHYFLLIVKCHLHCDYTKAITCKWVVAKFETINCMCLVLT